MSTLPAPSFSETRTIRPQEIAGRLGVCEITVYEMLHRGQIPAIRVGRRWLISRSRYERWESSFGEQAVA